MGSDEFLIVSYFSGGAACLCLALAAYAWLRRPADRIFGELHGTGWARVLKRSFPVSAVLLALSAFMAVNYYGCEGRSYSQIAGDRGYIISVNQKQISETASSLVIVVFVWAAVVLVNLVSTRRERAQERPRGED